MTWIVESDEGVNEIFPPQTWEGDMSTRHPPRFAADPGTSRRRRWMMPQPKRPLTKALHLQQHRAIVPKISLKTPSSRIMKFPYVLSFVACMATVEAGVPKPEILVSMAFAAQERRDVTKDTKGLETAVAMLLFLGVSSYTYTYYFVCFLF